MGNIDDIILGVARTAERKSYGVRGVPNVKIPFRDEQIMVINQAARARDISRSGYVKRAALGLACFDLGEDWDEVFADDWPAKRFGADDFEETYRKGRGAGLWLPTDLH